MPVLFNETERLNALYSYRILDTPEENDFDELTQLASVICQTPVALISLVDRHRQWFKSHIGTAATETPIAQSFCAHAIKDGDNMMVVDDATKDERFRNNPLVTGDPNIVFYAGVPLINEDGYALGTLCVIDVHHNQLSAQQADALKIIAKQVVDKLELRRKITALEFANRELKNSELRLKTLVEKAPVAIGILKGAELIIESANEQMLYYWGRDKQVIGEPLAMALPHLQSEPHVALLGEVLISGEPQFGYERKVVVAVENATTDYFLNLIYQPLKDDLGITHSVMVIASDITDQLNIRHQLINEQRRDEQRKNDFIAMVSHELKTPLTSLSGYVQMLGIKATKSADDFSLNTVDRAKKQIGKMTTMINGFLNVSRLEAGKINIDCRVFDMAMLMKECEEETGATVTSHTVVFKQIASAIVNADADKIGQVVSNLISNAVKYSPAETVINVTCAIVDGHARISVADEGMGINKKDIEKLFERFYRVESIDMKSISGFGIGLYLCAEIIKRHNGKIWVESILGNGSTFYFEIPVHLN